MSAGQNRLNDALFVAAYAGIIWCGWWLIMHPDEITAFKMRYLKEMELKCMRNAQFWADRADQYSKTYDGMRAVTL